ncbi:enhanced ethylene response protein 5-like [Triticum dicoccoides]|uniref:enhanced ethylene response protein 5-like n=1 Tax=Triticum dicoccoides TaxID=85692 RepID=UPI000E78F948|nr:enhanced ethylene response protein 5-like [Triticum dicoccoides]
MPPLHKLHRRTKRGPLIYVVYPRQGSINPPREQLCLSLDSADSSISCSNRENLTGLLKCGLYLVLDKLELQFYRRLVKKIHIIQREREPSKAHQIKIEFSATILVE